MNAIRILRRLGIRGCVKSVFNSLRHTRSPTSITAHSNCILALSAEANFNINGRIDIGVANTGASHPKARKSVLTVRPGGSLSHTGSEAGRFGPGCDVHVEGDLSIGDSYLNADSRILCGHEITIGDDCAIAWNVDLLDDDRHQICIDGEMQQRKAPIEIEDGVWIGHDVTVSKGVTIGEGAVVASNSVVTQNVDPNTLVAGCPAEPKSGSVTWSNADQR